MSRFAHAAPYAADLVRAFTRAPASPPVYARPAAQRYAGASLLGRLRAAMSLARQRRDLARLSDHQLRDIGLSAQDAAAEAARPVWDAPAHWR